MQLKRNPAGNYNYLTGIAPYSSGAVADMGYEVRHAQIFGQKPIDEALKTVASFLSNEGRPMQALCAIELRIPEPLSFSGFANFNVQYRNLIEQYDLLLGTDNPIARTNIAPAVGELSHPSMYAFSYTVESEVTVPTFVVAGAGDLRDQSELAPEGIILPGRTDQAAMRSKAATVMSIMQERLMGLGVSWTDVTDINVYTAQSLANYLVDSILDPATPAGRYGIRWHYSHPPIQGLAFEMNVRGVQNTIALRLS